MNTNETRTTSGTANSAGEVRKPNKGVLSRGKDRYSTAWLVWASERRSTEVNSGPGFAGLRGIEKVTGRDVAGTVFALTFNRVKRSTTTKGRG